VATPPGGHQYGGPQQQSLKRFNFPSAPSPQLQSEDERTSEPVIDQKPGWNLEPDPAPDPGPAQAPAQAPGQVSGQAPEQVFGRSRGQEHRPVFEPMLAAMPEEAPRPAPRSMPAQREPEPFASPPQIQPHMSAPPRTGDKAVHGPRPSRPTPVSSDQQPLVRPYAMTGGRTRPRYQLAIEALVATTADPEQLRGQLPEHQRICQLCREIKSVAEVSALLSLPLGVARILVADLAEAGLVAIHQPGANETAGGQPDVTLLERVLSGLRKL